MALQAVPQHPSRCTPRKALSYIDAKEEAREIRRHFRAKVLYDFCEACDAYHVKLDPDMALIDELSRRILELVALGYRFPEIAARPEIKRTEVVRNNGVPTSREVRLTAKAVELRVGRLETALGAQSLTHLVLLSCYLGIITPQQHFPGVRPHE